MNDFGLKIIQLCTEAQAQAYVLITVCCLIIGASLAMSEEGSEKVKKRLPWIITGWVVFCGAITLGAQYGNSLKF